MSISVDESTSAWKDFKTAEGKKFPHFGKEWFDTNGVISGTGKLRTWKWEANQYLKDRSAFIETLKPASSSQVEKPPLKKETIPTGERDKNHRGTNKVRDTKTSSTQKPVNMPRRTKRSQAWKKRGKGRRMKNKALSSVRVPFKLVIAVDSAKSSAETGHWHNHLTIAELAGQSLKSYEEFKCCSMKVRFIPQDITTGSGLYAACLLDQNGFGDPVKSTTIWFPRVADLPGARLSHITRGCMFSWRPTEPDSRNYRKVLDESTYVVASFYIFGDSASLPIKGQLLVTGLLRGRGEFYSSSLTGRIKALSLMDAEVEDEDDLQSLNSNSG